MLESRIKNDQAAGQLTERGEALRKELEAAGGKAPAASWSRLARYLEADGKLPEAGRAIDRAIEADPRSVPAWALAARIRESAGNLGDAAEAYRRLAEIDRRNRTEYLTQVAKLEARLGRTDQALKAGRDLIAAAPGQPRELRVLRPALLPARQARRGPRHPPPRRPRQPQRHQDPPDPGRDPRRPVPHRGSDRDVLAGLREGRGPRRPARHGQPADRAVSPAQPARPAAGPAPAREGESQQNQREVSICLAQAYASSGDLGMARSELERLLAANARDTQLLQQLSKLAEEEGDLEGAAKHQKQLNELAPSDEGQLRLAQLYVRHGDLEEAQGIWTQMALAQKDSQHMLQAIDRLLGSEKPAAVLEITESMIRKDPHDWEALYREGLALAGMGKNEDAAQRFRRLLDLRQNDDDKSAFAKARLARPEAAIRRLTARRASAGRSRSRWRSGSSRPPGPHGTQARVPVSYSTTTATTIWTPGGLRPGPHGGPGLACEPGPRPG